MRTELSRMRPSRAGEAGSALVLALLVVAIVASLGVALMDLVAGERLITKNREQAARALLVAQAGLALAKRELAHDGAWPGETALPIDEGESMDVRVEAVDTTQRRVTSTGRVPGGERVVQALIALGDPAVVGDESVVSGSWRER